MKGNKSLIFNYATPTYLLFTFWFFFGAYLLSSRIINASFAHNQEWIGIIFLFGSLVSFLFFKKDYSAATWNSKTIAIPIGLLIFLIILFLVGSSLINNNFPLSQDNYSILIRHHFHFVAMEPGYLLAKIPELIFQQLIILGISLWIWNRGHSGLKLVKLFALIFGFAHLPMLIFAGPSGLYFIIASILSSIAFPILICYLKNGIVYSLMVHFLFYLISGVVVRLFFIAELINVMKS